MRRASWWTLAGTVVVRIEHRQNGKTISQTKFEDFVETAGCWWGAADRNR